jgi:hypothetical protein
VLGYGCVGGMYASDFLLFFSFPSVSSGEGWVGRWEEEEGLERGGCVRVWVVEDPGVT